MESNNTPTQKEAFYNKFKNIEPIISLVAVLAVLTKIAGLHFPGLAPIFIVSMGASAVFTYLFAFSGSIIYENKKPIPVMILCLASAIVIVGVLFSLMFWPGGRTFLISGFFASLIALAWLAGGLSKESFGLSSIYNKALLFKVVFFCSIAAWALISPVEVYKSASIHGNDPIAVRLYEEHINDPKNIAKTKAYFEYTNSKNNRHR